MRAMITDSIAYVEQHLERILEEAGKTTDNDKKQLVFEKYLRFWNMMAMLHKEGRVNKRKMLVNVFNQYSEELDTLLALGIISYTNEKFPDTPVGKKADSISSLIHQSLDSVALQPGSPKLNTAFGLLLKDPLMIKQME